MTDDRHDCLKELFLAASNLPTEERGAYLDEACRDDPELRAEVERLLAEDTDATGPLDSPALGHGFHLPESPEEPVTSTGGSSPPEPPALPEQIGSYRIIRVLGRGGMGVVYEAEQERPKRTVALKVINPGVTTERMLKRFEVEAEILGRLQHPSIAQIFEAGTFDAGAGVQPFFAMEYIQGEPLTQYAAKHHLSRRERLELMAKICDAVQHAHQRGVIHRDLKPSNILVDESGEPRILDFGVARATDGDIQTTTLQTDIGQLIGTVPYMSPEQAAGDPDELDTRSDVYALGVVAYELLAGRLPYDLQRKLVHEAVRVIREDDPTPLSSVDRVFRGDVETIVGKALEKEKSRRYQTASDLASDIRRYLSDEPIAARRPSTWYQVRKFARRNTGLVTGVAAAFVILVAGVITSSVFAFNANEQKKAAEAATGEATRREGEARAARELAQQRAEDLEAVTGFQVKMIGSLDPEQVGLGIINQQRGSIQNARQETDFLEEDVASILDDFDDVVARTNPTDLALYVIDTHILKPAQEALVREFSDQPLVRASLDHAIGRTYLGLGRYEEALESLDRALSLRRRHLGNDDPDIALAVNSVGMALAAMDRNEEAMQHYVEAFQTRQRLLGDDHPRTVESRSNIGATFYQMSQYAEAEPYLVDVLDKRRRLLGNAHSETLESINNLGALFYATARYEEASSLFEEGVASRRRVYGNDDPGTLLTIANLAHLLSSMGRYSDAEPLYREVLATRRRVLGDRHRETLQAMNSVAYMLENSDRLDEAAVLYRTALEGQRAVLGDEHGDTLQTLSDLATVLSSQGDREAAEALYREALDTARRVHGDGHEHTLSLMMRLAILLAQNEKFDESEALMSESLEGSRRIHNDDHPDTLRTIMNLGALLAVQERHRDAEPYFAEAYATQRKILGADHPSTLASMHNLASVKINLADFEAAEQLAVESQKHHAKRWGVTDYRNARAIRLIVDLYTAWHEAEPGQGYDRKAAEWRAELSTEGSESESQE